jgi:hypothetical protein
LKGSFGGSFILGISSPSLALIASELNYSIQIPNQVKVKYPKRENPPERRV